MITGPLEKCSALQLWFECSTNQSRATFYFPFLVMSEGMLFSYLLSLKYGNNASSDPEILVTYDSLKLSTDMWAQVTWGLSPTPRARLTVVLAHGLIVSFFSKGIKFG